MSASKVVSTNGVSLLKNKSSGHAIQSNGTCLVNTWVATNDSEGEYRNTNYKM